MSKSITCENISLDFLDGTKKTSIIKNLNLRINQGDNLVVLGRSGSGKSTLLNIMGGLLKPSGGRIIVNDIDILELNNNDLSSFRGSNYGFIYQFHHLLKDFTAIENVMFPLQILGDDKEIAHSKAKKIMNKLGLNNRINHRSADLSGGERQRVAIARAIVHEPKYIFADEPTGSLDSKNSENVLSLLLKICEEKNASLIMVTHDEKVAAKFENKIYLT